MVLPPNSWQRSAWRAASPPPAAFSGEYLLNTPVKMLIHALRVNVFKGIGEQIPGLLPTNWPCHLAQKCFFSYYQVYYSPTVSPCKGREAGKPLRQSIRFFPRFFPDVWCSFLVPFFGKFCRMISCENYDKSPRESPLKFMIIERNPRFPSLCPVFSAQATGHFDGFPSGSFTVRVLARFFLFVYNETRIETTFVLAK